jgi:pimeloyl-ACP methyl ester carboxylesterase
MEKIIRVIFRYVIIIFVLLNIIAAFHGYKFTHFGREVKKLEKPKQLTTGDKIKTIFFGVESTRPGDLIKPSQKYETVYLQSNVKLECWSLKAGSAKGTVIIFHGYRGSKSEMIDRSDEFLKLGYNTLLVDFMGSGGSEGNSTTIGYKEAEEVKTCYDYVASTGEKNIYLFGTSMGAAAIMKAENDYQLNAAGLILECPFGTMYKTVSVRIKAMGAPSFPIAGMLMFWGGVESGFWPFSHNPEDYAKSIKLPTLLLYGEVDKRVSRGETDAIYTNLQGPKTLKTFPLSGHEDYLPQYHDLWVSDVSSFLQNNGH